MTTAEAIAAEHQLREQLREAVRTLSNARRSQVWEIVNAMLEIARSEPRQP